MTEVSLSGPEETVWIKKDEVYKVSGVASFSPIHSIGVWWYIAEPSDTNEGSFSCFGDQVVFSEPRDVYFTSEVDTRVTCRTEAL